MSDPDKPATDEQHGQIFGQQFSRFMNSFHRERHNAAVDVMLHDHRSLQQSYMRFFMRYVEGLAKQGSDARNQAAVDLAKAIMQLPEAQKALPLV